MKIEFFFTQNLFGHPVASSFAIHVSNLDAELRYKKTQFRRELNFRNWGSPFGSLQDMDFFYDPHKATMLLIDTPLELQLLCLWASFLIASHKRLACQFHSFYEALHVNEKYNLRKLKKEMFISLTTRQKRGSLSIKSKSQSCSKFPPTSSKSKPKPDFFSVRTVVENQQKKVSCFL